MSRLAKLPLMVLSFILSLILWAYVQIQEDPPKPVPTNYVVDVEMKRLPASLVVVRPPVPIKIFPIGKPDEIARIDKNDLSAFVDLTNAKVGQHSYPVRIVVQGDYDVKWDLGTPVASVTIDEKAMRVVPVRVQTSGLLSSNDHLYLPDSTFTEPSLIQITGPKSDVENVVYARAVLDLSRVSPGRSYSSEIELLEAADRPASSMIDPDPKTVVIRPGIAVGLDVRKLHVQPTYRGQPAVGFVVKRIEVSPENVQVRGRPQSLTALSILPSHDIDLSGLKQSTTFILTPNLPQDIILWPPETITVNVIIEPIKAPGPKPTPAARAPGAATTKRRAGG